MRAVKKKGEGGVVDRGVMNECQVVRAKYLVQVVCSEMR